VSRGASRAACSGFGLGEHVRKDLFCVVLGDLASVFLAQPVDGLEYRHEVLEVASGFGIDGIHRAEHLCGEQNVVDADSLDKKLHRLLVVDRHVPVDLARDILEGFEAFFNVHTALPVPVVGDGAAAVGNDDLELGKIFKDARP